MDKFRSLRFAFFTLDIFLISWFASRGNQPVTTGTSFFIIPPFSLAISEIRWPKISQ